jgi:hypothetical protein
MDPLYETEFVHFVKTLIINSSYAEYCKQVNIQYNNSLDSNVYTVENQEYRKALICYKNEIRIWEKVFVKVHDLFIYYLHLSTNFQNVLTNQPKLTYEQSQLASTYCPLSFQDYIDESVNFLKVGYREYVNFTKSMQNAKFKEKMVEKYKIDAETRILKNHIIHIIQLHLAKNIGNSKYFTDQEQNVMDSMINAIPYFEHMNKTKGSNRTMEIGVSNTFTTFTTLEQRVFEKINNII